MSKDDFPLYFDKNGALEQIMVVIQSYNEEGGIKLPNLFKDKSRKKDYCFYCKLISNFTQNHFCIRYNNECAYLLSLQNN